jgi:hypothetical protein
LQPIHFKRGSFEVKCLKYLSGSKFLQISLRNLPTNKSFYAIKKRRLLLLNHL